MSDIMELIVKHAVHWKIGTVEETEALKKEIETRLSAMQEVCDKVKEVYEKYKHLDELLSDREFLDEKNIKAMILYDLWQAIKE